MQCFKSGTLVKAAQQPCCSVGQVYLVCSLGRPNLKVESLRAQIQKSLLHTQGPRRHRLAESTLPGDAPSRESPQQASESPPTATACTLSGHNTISSPGSSDGHMACQQTMLSCGTKKTRSLHGPPMFDIVASAGVHPGQSALQHFPLPDKSGLFADMLGHMDFNVSGGTLSPKLLVRQLLLLAGHKYLQILHRKKARLIQ